MPRESYQENNTAVRAMAGGEPYALRFDMGGSVSSISPALAHKIGCQRQGLTTGFRMPGERPDLPQCDDFELEPFIGPNK